MPSQIEIDIRANSSQARQAVEQLTQDVTRLKQQMAAPGTAGSGLLTPLPAGLGGQSMTPLLDAATAAAKRNAGALREVTGATNELGEVTQRAGINIQSMLERMAVRLVIFEALRLAIQGVMYVLDQISKAQQAKIQFDALSLSVDHLEARFRMLKESASKALMPIDQAEKLRETLIDLGATEEQSVYLTRELGQWSHVLGIDSERLAQALGHVAAGEGSLQEMRLVTRMMGDQREAGIQLIETYQGLERAQKALEAENKTIAQSMEAVIKATEQMGEAINRNRSRSADFLKQTGVLQQIMPQLPQGAAGGWVTYTPPAGMTQAGLKELDKLVLDYIKQYQAGLAELKKRYGYQQPYSEIAGLYGIAPPPSLSPEYIMKVGQEAQADQLKQLQDKDQADKAHQKFMQDQAAVNTAAAKADLAKLPQAVGGPPAAVWDAWQNSIEGLKTQASQDIDKLIDAWNKGVSDLSKSMDTNASATNQIVTILSGGT